MAIPAQDVQNLFTKKLIAIYKEKNTPTEFLRSFFPAEEAMTKEISIGVRRGTEYVAVDVRRHSDGNLVTFNKSTEKIFVPPYYHQYLVANDHRLYDTVISSGSAPAFAQLAAELAEDVVTMRQTIERSYEKQCAEVLTTGIVTLANGDNIDFKRKAGSLVDLVSAGGYWTTNSVDPRAAFKAAGEFLRKEGKAAGAVFNAIVGSDVLNVMLNNTTFQGVQDMRRIDLGTILMPQRNAVGASLHGQISAGSYLFNIWTYEQYYTDSNGVQQEYMDPKKVVVIPEAPMFKLGFGAVPQLIEGGNIPQRGAYLVQEFFDQRRTAHEIHIKSAGIAIPVAVDQIYTFKAIA
jgi:hypothetical protein